MICATPAIAFSRMANINGVPNGPAIGLGQGGFVYTVPAAASYMQKEDAASYVQQEDSSSKIAY